ncbi:MAG: SDR family oxidoreductase [Erysipelotrichaceae bacterium]
MTYKNNSESDIKKILKEIPLKRMANTNEIAELVYFLGSDKNTYITGQRIAIDGGFTVK